jgi:tetratricopeptide (TPR) repeat protein
LALLGADEEWIGADPDSAARRAMLLGLSLKFLRDLDAARRQFETCASASKEAGNDRLVLQSGAELAEIDWRHGGEAGRERAARRVNELISGELRQDDFKDELASLQYQLGASLVMAGKREAAAKVLEGALEKTNSSYWQMRLSNALGSAHYYLGNLRDALSSSERAWRHAVEGEIDSFKPRILASMAGIRFGLGMFREAAEQDEMAAFWGRRIGNPFEYEAGLLAASSDLVHIAAFERALAAASEVRRVANAEPPSRHVAKSFEIEALTHLHLGDYASAQECVTKADSIMAGRGFDDLVPRLRWHEGRIAVELGNYSDAEARFVEALEVLEQTRDWEDLPGVQVEMQLLFARAGDNRLDPEKLCRLLDNAREGELVIVQLRTILVLAEIARLHSNLLGDILPKMTDGLRLGERSGAREYVWRLSYWTALALASIGDPRGAVARMSTGVRVLREVASELTPQHRSSYLATSHARLLLSETQLGK